MKTGSILERGWQYEKSDQKLKCCQDIRHSSNNHHSPEREPLQGIPLVAPQISQLARSLARIELLELDQPWSESWEIVSSAVYVALQEMSFHGPARDWPYLRWIALQDFVVRPPPQTAVLVLALAEIQEHGVDTLICARLLQLADFFTCDHSGLAILSKQKTVREYNLLL